jgi:hypothetical protein
MEKVDANVPELSPWSSGLNISDAYAFDVAHYTRLLVENSKRLFVHDDQLWVKVIEVGERGASCCLGCASI